MQVHSCKDPNTESYICSEKNKKIKINMLSKEDARLLLNIVDDLIDNKDSEPFRQPVDYKGK